MDNRNDSYIIQPVQYINEKVQSPFLNNYFITFSLMGTPNTLQNSAHTRAAPKYISTEIDENNIYYLELPKNNCTLDICIWHGTEGAGYTIYEKTCIAINRDDFVNQPMKEISVKFSDYSQLLVRIKLEDDFIDYYEKQINNIIDNLLIDLQRLLVRNLGGDICAAIGFILEKFDNDLFRNRILTSEKLAHYSEPLVTYLQYNLNIFFDKLSNDLDPLNSIIYYIWLECLAIIRYTAIGELEHRSRTLNYENVNSYPFLDETRKKLNTDMLHSISAPGRVFKGKINERQIKYLSYVMEVLKDLFNCGGSGIPYEKLEQKEFKEVRSILGHYPCDNKKLKVIYNHYMERNFSLYDHIWILNLLVAKGSSRFIRVKEYEMKVMLEKKLKGLNKKYQSSLSFYENHKRIASSSVSGGSPKMPVDMPLYDEIDDELNSNIDSKVGSYSGSNGINSASGSGVVSRPDYSRPSTTQSSIVNANENEKLTGYETTNSNIVNNTIGNDGELVSQLANKNEDMGMLTKYNKPNEDSHATLIDSHANVDDNVNANTDSTSVSNSLNNKISNEVLNKDDDKRNSGILTKNSNINDPKNTQKMIPYVISHAQNQKVI